MRSALSWCSAKNLRFFWELCGLDLKQRTAGTAMGLLWVYVNPIISISIVWFVSYFGLRVNARQDGVYSLLVGLISWQLIQDVVLIGLGAFVEKPYLVKKIRFPLLVLPLIKVTNSFRLYLPFIGLCLIISGISGHLNPIGIAAFVGFYLVLYFFLFSVVLMLSTAFVFFRDLASFVGMLMQLLFWATPIIWNVPENPKFISAIETFNPIYFAISVFRFSFLEQNLPEGYTAVVFVAILFLLPLASFKIFNQLKEQFADVL